ncbi:hypothetical protein AEP_00730 [Curvibacter sp. AEP1-3]|uniref:hypothetical protein n=1 Tax=Curvibacter sp. AEP1-3 TaxID=1844971 RepID=UPI000B3C7328|nr:hypothetical protein [Curvibacter sp. AEP1-3]ARV17689.1 hypothetical protein AEP_00730 [Curvibacter sp. AEP1-3]
MPNPLHPADTNTSLWKQTTVLRNAQGEEEAISVGPDGYVWSFIADSGDSRFDASGQRLENLGMPADFVTVGRNAAGALVVIAAKGLHLQYRTETPLTALDIADGLSHRWTPAKPVQLPVIAGAVGVRRLYTQNDFSGMRIALIVDTETAEHGSSYVMACSQWTENGPGPFILLPPLGAKKATPVQPAPSQGVRMFRTAQAA